MILSTFDGNTHPLGPDSSQGTDAQGGAAALAGQGQETDSGNGRSNPSLHLSLVRPEPGVVLVRMSGEIDMNAAPRLGELIQQRLTAAFLRLLVLDLEAVTFCDSSGLELLLEAQHKAEHRGIALYLVPGDSAVRRLLTLTGLTERFACRAHVSDVIAYPH